MTISGFLEVWVITESCTASAVPAEPMRNATEAYHPSVPATTAIITRLTNTAAPARTQHSTAQHSTELKLVEKL